MDDQGYADLNLDKLRKSAEERLSPAPSLNNETLRLLHELQVHRVELEMQNNQLRETRQDLEASLANYTDLFDFAPIGYVTLDRSGSILSVNLRAAQLLSLERFRLKGRKFEHFVAPADRPAFATLIGQTFSNSPQESCELTLINREHATFSIQLRALATSSGQECRMALIDLTELKRTKQDLVESRRHRMEALGLLAGGIAHNFNNNLAIIMGNIDLAMAKLPPESASRTQLDKAKIGVFRSRDLVQQILTYSRQSSVHKGPTSLQEMVNETLKLLDATIPKTVHLHKIITASGSTATANANSSQLQEALINLCNNSVHAMNEAGELTVLLDTASLTADDFTAPYACHQGTYAKISVQDSGAGMTPETIKQIFDPFFTTKDVGSGTGMGLSIVQGIVVQHGGLIKVISDPRQGSTFELYIPRIEDCRVGTPTAGQILPRGHEKVLFLDDDSLLCEAWSEILREYGYQVTEETNSLRALELIKADPQQFDLVITDQTMPGLSGKDLITELQRIRPDLPTILCTGHSNLISAEAAKKSGINAFCMKPLALAEMIFTVRKVLDEPGIIAADDKPDKG